MRAVLPHLPTGILLILLSVAASTSVSAQDAESLPDDFDELIQLKTQTLEQYSELQKSGPPNEALQVLRKIINIHRKALKVAIAENRSDDVIGQLQQVFTNDTEFLSDQLFARGGYTESATLRKEVEQSYQRYLGPEHNATRTMHWKAIVADKLSAAAKDKQAAYLAATGAEAQARQALQNGQLDVAAQIYAQLIDAQIAVLGENHPNVAVDLNEFGRILWMQKQHEQAESVYQRSLNARAATTGKDLQFATTSFNLGRVYQDTNRLADAEKQYLATAAIEEPILGSTNESFLQTLQQLASLYEQSGDAAKLAAIQQRIAAADPLATVISHLPKGTFAAAAIQPSGLLTNPGLQMLPFEIIEAAGNQELGFSPLDVDALIAFATLPVAEPPFNGGFVFKLKEGVEVKYRWTTSMQAVPGQPWLKAASGGSDAMCFVEFRDGVAMVGTEEAVRQSLTNAGENQVGAMLLADRDQGQLIAATDLRMVRPIVQMALQETPPAPPALEQLKSIPIDTDTIQLRLNLSQGLQLSLILASADDQSAERVAAAISNGLEFGLQLALQEVESEMNGDDPVQIATRTYAQRIARQYFNKLQPAVQGSSVVMEFDATEQSLAPLVAALLLPAIQAARGAAQRTQDMNNMRQIGLAMHIYHDTHGSFPARATYDKDGKALLSWRVHLLPFLDQQQLYNQFKLDEPWDSEHNMELSKQIPEVYQSKQFEDPAKTIYLTLNGTGTFMEGTTALKFTDLTDGSSNTLMVVEANPESAVIWTKPEDLSFNVRNPRNGLGSVRPEGFQACFADGSVRLIRAEIDDETLRRLAIRNDGEPIDEF